MQTDIGIKTRQQVAVRYEHLDHNGRFANTAQHHTACSVAVFITFNTNVETYKGTVNGLEGDGWFGVVQEVFKQNTGHVSLAASKTFAQVGSDLAVEIVRQSSPVEITKTKNGVNQVQSVVHVFWRLLNCNTGLSAAERDVISTKTPIVPVKQANGYTFGGDVISASVIPAGKQRTIARALLADQYRDRQELRADLNIAPRTFSDAVSKLIKAGWITEDLTPTDQLVNITPSAKKADRIVKSEERARDSADNRQSRKKALKAWHVAMRTVKSNMITTERLVDEYGHEFVAERVFNQDGTLVACDPRSIDAAYVMWSAMADMTDRELSKVWTIPACYKRSAPMFGLVPLSESDRQLRAKHNAADALKAAA
jgi:DNA-binding MarR family transcriptional regulator